MAGIGFVFRKLVRQDSLTGPLRAFAHATVAAAGPWLLTILTLSGIGWIAARRGSDPGLERFRLVVAYNFAFSLVITAPIIMAATRYLADAIYRHELQLVSGLLCTCFAFTYPLLALCAGLFYVYATPLPEILDLQASINFLLLGGIWICTVFISALRDYRAVSAAFLAGGVCSVLLVGILPPKGDGGDLLLAFNIGGSVILAILLTAIFKEYPDMVRWPRGFSRYLLKHWQLMAGALAYQLGIWVDKWIMWCAPERLRTVDGFLTYPGYENAMFYALLTAIPALAMFIISSETRFFEYYHRFYSGIRKHATLELIEQDHQALLNAMYIGAGPLLLIQSAISTVVILEAPWLFEVLGLKFLELGIFRIGVLAALFLTLTLILTIYLTYFDCVRELLLVQLCLGVCNVVFSWLTLKLGFAYYGYGFFLACVVTFLLAAHLTYRYLQDLPYHTFVTKNLATSRQWMTPPDVV
jgi:polysaccharide biosynthesis protein PelG